jgi:hypothetical protein
MDQPGTIAAVMARLDFLEKRVSAVESVLFNELIALGTDRPSGAEMQDRLAALAKQSIQVNRG